MSIYHPRRWMEGGHLNAARGLILPLRPSFATPAYPPPSLNSIGEGVTLEVLPVKTNYYRFSEDSNGVYSCGEFGNKRAKNCLGSGNVTANASAASASRRLDGASTSSADDDAEEAGQTWGDATCVPWATGPLCAIW